MLRNHYDSLDHEPEKQLENVDPEFREAPAGLRIAFERSHHEHPATIKPKQPAHFKDFERFTKFTMAVKEDGHGVIVTVNLNGDITVRYRSSGREQLTYFVVGHFTRLAYDLQMEFLGELIITCDGKSTGYEGVNSLLGFVKENPEHERIQVRIVLYWIHRMAGHGWNKFILDEETHATPWDFLRECVHERSRIFSVVDTFPVTQRNGNYECTLHDRPLRFPTLESLEQYFLGQAELDGEEGWVAWCPGYRYFLSTLKEPPKCVPGYKDDSPRTDLACKVRAFPTAVAVCFRLFIDYQDRFVCFVRDGGSLVKCCTLNTKLVHPSVRISLLLLKHIGNFEEVRGISMETALSNLPGNGVLLTLQFSGLSSGKKPSSHKYVRGPMEKAYDLDKVTILSELCNRHWKATTRALDRARRIVAGDMDVSEVEADYVEAEACEYEVMSQAGEQHTSESPRVEHQSQRVEHQSQRAEHQSQEAPPSPHQEDQESVDQTMEMVFARRRERESRDKSPQHQPMDYQAPDEPFTQSLSIRRSESPQAEQPCQEPEAQASQTPVAQEEPVMCPEQEETVRYSPEPARQASQAEPEMREETVRCSPGPARQASPEMPPYSPIVWDSIPVNRRTPRIDATSYPYCVRNIVRHTSNLVGAIYTLLSMTMLPHRLNDVSGVINDVLQNLVCISINETRARLLDDLDNYINWKTMFTVRDDRYVLREDLMDKTTDTGLEKGKLTTNFVRVRLLKHLPRPHDVDSMLKMTNHKNYKTTVEGSQEYIAMIRYLLGEQDYKSYLEGQLVT